MTPGSAAPVVSLTVPAIALWANACVARITHPAIATTNSVLNEIRGGRVANFTPDPQGAHCATRPRTRNANTRKRRANSTAAHNQYAATGRPRLPLTAASTRARRQKIFILVVPFAQRVRAL